MGKWIIHGNLSFSCMFCRTGLICLIGNLSCTTVYVYEIKNKTKHSHIYLQTRGFFLLITKKVATKLISKHTSQESH